MVNEPMQKKQKLMLEKKFPKSLGTYKLAHTRQEDPHDTLVVKSFGVEQNEQFGVKGINQIRDAFCCILKLMGEENKSIIKKTKFIERKDLEELFQFTTLISKETII